MLDNDIMYWTDKKGHERVRGNRKMEDGSWIDTKRVSIHRLTSVAWFGMDAISNRDIHHRVNIPWLNTESNLLPVPPAEHWVLTGGVMRNGPRESIIEDVTEGFGYGE